LLTIQGGTGNGPGFIPVGKIKNGKEGSNYTAETRRDAEEGGEEIED